MTSANSHEIPPLRGLRAVFLDVGNTLVSMDYAWIIAELANLGVALEAQVLERADARARPEVSQRVRRTARTEGADLFTAYLGDVLAHALPHERREVDEIAARLAAALRIEGYTERLWSRALPRVLDALIGLERAGLRRIVVSNSDGTVERALVRARLRDAVETVVDSRVVGFEKPDARIFTHALAIAGCRPEEAVHVGDLYDADVVGARAAGVHAVLVDPHGDYEMVDCPRVTSLYDFALRLGVIID